MRSEAGDHVRAYRVTGRPKSGAKRGTALALGLAWVLLNTAQASAAAQAQTAASRTPTVRLLTREEGRSIVNVAWQQEPPLRGALDCSHLTYQIYKSAGFEYPYASSFELYAGSANFARVKFPHAGDLVVWPGHVGIIVDPMQHSFFSLVRTGLEEQDYESPYWKSRGRPHFFRYRVENGLVLTAKKTAEPSQPVKLNDRTFMGPIAEDEPPADAEDRVDLNRPPKTPSKRTDVLYGPQAPVESMDIATPFHMPSTVLIATGSKVPTRDDVAESFSEFADAGGNVLRTDDLTKIQSPVVIVERFTVQRLDLKRDRGSAVLEIESKMSVNGGTAQLKAKREKVRWELQRTESGWEAVAPLDKTYVPHDVAVKSLAAQLAELTASQGTQHQESLLRRESQLARLLSVLLDSK